MSPSMVNNHIKGFMKTYYYKALVPLTHDGDKGWIFNLNCPGNAFGVSLDGLLMLKNATVNRNLGFDDACKEKEAYVAYNNGGSFMISNITWEMVKSPVEPWVSYVNIAWEWETQAAFFKYNNIEPQWFNANYTWGTLNFTTGQWSGAVGMIQRDEADYAIFGFAGTYPRSMVSAFSPGLSFSPYHWLTRYPQELPPTWNLLGLFTKVIKFTNEQSEI